MYSSQYMQNKTNYNKIMSGGFLDKNIRDEQERQRQEAEVLRQRQAEVLRQRQEAEVLRRREENERIRIEREQRELERREELQRTDPARAAMLQRSLDSVANIANFDDGDEMPVHLPLTRSG